MSKIADITQDQYVRICHEMVDVCSHLYGYNGFVPETIMIHPLGIIGHNNVGWVKCEVYLGKVVMTSRDAIGDRYESVWHKDFGDTWQVPAEEFEKIFRHMYDDLGKHRIDNPA